MKTLTTHKKSGFTIIEVVLVLAIAALIFLIVFLAVPTLQKNQRDTQRRSDMARMISQLQSYQSNHAGSVPAATNGTGAGEITSFITKYMASGSGTAFTSPGGNPYIVTGQSSTTTVDSTVDTIDYYTSAVCKDGTLQSDSNPRSVAIVTTLEASNDQYCLSN